MTGSAGGRGLPAWTHRADPGTALPLVGLPGRCGPGTPRARQARRPAIKEAVLKAAEAWREYRACGGGRTRIAGDFLIGAHAMVAATRLLSRGRGFYRRYFAGLELLDPSRVRSGSGRNSERSCLFLSGSLAPNGGEG